MEISNKTKEYHVSNTSVYSCQYHVVFCPKYRREVLTEDVAKRLKEIIYYSQKEFNYIVIDLEVMLDHVHLLLDVNPKEGIYNVVNHIKGRTSRLLRSEFPKLKSRLPTLWTRSKFISSVGSVSLETVKKYIENQKNI
jgi:putative transposase